MSTTHNDPTAADVPELGADGRDNALRAVVTHETQPWHHRDGASAADIRQLLTLNGDYVDEWIAHAHREGLIALVSIDGQTERWVPTEAGRARFASLPPKRLPGDRSDPPVVIRADEYLPPWDAGLDNRTRAGVDLIVQIIGDASGGDARGAVTEGYVRSALRALAAAAPTDQGRWLMAAKDTGMVNAVYGSARPVELTGLGRDHYATLTDRQQILDRIGRELAEVRRIAKDKGPSVRRAVWEWAKADLRNTTPLGWLLGLLRTGVFVAGVVVWYQLAGPFFVQLPGGAEPAAAAPPGWVDGFTVGALSTVAAAFAVAAYVWPSPPRQTVLRPTGQQHRRVSRPVADPLRAKLDQVPTDLRRTLRDNLRAGNRGASLCLDDMPPSAGDDVSVQLRQHVAALVKDVAEADRLGALVSLRKIRDLAGEEYAAELVRRIYAVPRARS